MESTSKLKSAKIIKGLLQYSQTTHRGVAIINNFHKNTKKVANICFTMSEWM